MQNKRASQYIVHLPDGHAVAIFTIFGTSSVLYDVSNKANFIIIDEGVKVLWGLISRVPVRKLRRPYNCSSTAANFVLPSTTDLRGREMPD
jgi:hypothetical protein